MATIKISCETQDAKIMYTTDDSEPTESSNLYSDVFEVDSPVTIKARAFKEGYEPSDIATKTYTPVTVPMALPDGSVLFYDRGSQYGEYHIGDDGYPVRLTAGADDSSATSNNWRYLICDQHDLDNGTFQWGPFGTSEDTGTAVGYGLPNTEAMIAKYADNADYWWKLAKEKRNSTGLKWFMPSKDELNLIYESRTVITGQGGDTFLTDASYWSSSGNGSGTAWCQVFSNGNQNNSLKRYSGHCRLLRRI